MKPDNPYALHGLAQILSASGEYLSALDAYQNAINNYRDRDIKPFDWYQEMGGVYEKIGENENAIEAYSKALEINPDDLQSANRLSILLQEFNK